MQISCEMVSNVIVRQLAVCITKKLDFVLKPVCCNFWSGHLYRQEHDNAPDWSENGNTFHFFWKKVKVKANVNS